MSLWTALFGRAPRPPVPAPGPAGSPPPQIKQVEIEIAAASGLVVTFEGLQLSPYRDATGLWTYGYGSTRDPAGNPVTQHTPPLTEAAARQLLARDLHAAFAVVAADVHETLTAGQAAALADFVYNLGAGALASSTLLKDINAGRFADAAGQFDLWDQAGGRALAGLLRRREAERVLFEGLPHPAVAEAAGS